MLISSRLGQGDAYAYYQGRPDELSVALEKPTAIFPYFAMEKLPVGIAGVLIAAIFSATMSTLSSDINSAATAFTTDFYRRFNKKTTDHQCLNVARIATVALGVLGCAFALYIAHVPNAVIYDLFNEYLGLLVGGLGGLFMMGIFTRRINGASALVAFLIALVVVVCIKKFTPLSSYMYGLVTLGTSVASGLLLSFILGKPENVRGLTLWD